MCPMCRERVDVRNVHIDLELVLDKRVSVYWQGEKQWYEGVITGRGPAPEDADEPTGTMGWEISYDDGTLGWVASIDGELVRLLDVLGEYHGS